MFGRKVLLSILNSRKFSNAAFFRQIVLQNLQRENLGFCETEYPKYQNSFRLCPLIVVLLGVTEFGSKPANLGRIIQSGACNIFV